MRQTSLVQNKTHTQKKQTNETPKTKKPNVKYFAMTQKDALRHLNLYSTLAVVLNINLIRINLTCNMRGQTCHPNTQEAVAGRFHAHAALTRAKK